MCASVEFVLTSGRLSFIRELMQRSGKDFILMKVLPFGIYHFRFIVDGHLRYDPELPCDFNDPSGAYNIMDLKVVIVLESHLSAYL